MKRRLRFALTTNEPFERLVRSTPPLRARARRSAARYVAGETLEEALAVAARLRAAGLDCSLDLFGERERDPAAIEEALRGYERLAARCASMPRTAATGCATCCAGARRPGRRLSGHPG